MQKKFTKHKKTWRNTSTQKKTYGKKQTINKIVADEIITKVPNMQQQIRGNMQSLKNKTTIVMKFIYINTKG